MIVFVVLHYQNINVTKECISYLKGIKNIEETKIIIVDNGSPNNSGEELIRLYEDESNIDIVKSQENLGFARGNNLGYLRAKTEYKADIIVVMNSDVFITDKDFISKLMFCYCNNQEVGICAPDILNLNNIHCNPMIIPPISVEGIKKIYKNSFFRYILYSIPLVNRILLSRAAKKDSISKKDKIGWENARKDIVPDGSCIIFFSEWIKNEDFAFLPVTFMYAEEHILYEYSKSKGYSVLYDPCMQVHHMEGGTTSSLWKNDIKKAIKNKKMNLKWHMDACKIYLKYRNAKKI